MARRSAALFLMLVTLILGSILWLGVRMARDEQRFVRAEFEDLLRTRLKAAAEVVSQWQLGYEQRLLALLQQGPRDIGATREFLLREPLVEHLFILDAHDQLVLPNPHAPDLSESERRFLQRTREIWEGGRFQRPVATEQRSISKVSKFMPSEKLYWWHPYYWSDGMHLLFLSHESGRTIGFELSSARFLAEMSAYLQERLPPTDKAATLVLKDGMGRVLFQSNADAGKGGGTLFEPLPEPLDSWRITVSNSSAVQVGRSALFNLLSGTLLLAVMVILLAVFYARAQRREMREAAQRVSFVNQVSHELKTPLTNIRMYAELLEQQLPDDEERSRRHVQVIVSESQRLSRLIGNVLTFASKERKTLRFTPRAVSLREVLQSTLEQFRPALSEKGIQVECRIEEERKVSADRDIFQQIVGNLISNVEKYAAEGKYLGIELKVLPGESLLVVSDRGPGVPAEERERVFQPFYRISDRVTEGVAGAGIGLAIVRDLARLHGGDVSLRESASGAVFKVRLSTPAVDGGAV